MFQYDFHPDPRLLYSGSWMLLDICAYFLEGKRVSLWLANDCDVMIGARTTEEEVSRRCISATLPSIVKMRYFPLHSICASNYYNIYFFLKSLKYNNVYYPTKKSIMRSTHYTEYDVYNSLALPVTSICWIIIVNFPCSFCFQSFFYVGQVLLCSLSVTAAFVLWG